MLLKKLVNKQLISIKIALIIKGIFHLSAKKFFLFKKLPIKEDINIKTNEINGAEAKKNIATLKL